LRRLAGAAGPWFVHHSGYRMGMPGVALDPMRPHRILAFLLDEGLAETSDVTEPIPVSLERIGLVHTTRYLDSLDRPESLEPVLGFAVSHDEAQRIIDHQRIVTGGTIHAARLALKTGRIAVNLCGGFHHAAPDGGQGFCVFNDVAVAIARLRRKRFNEPILVVDLDIHDGNGTRAVFASDPTVFTLSIHNQDWDPIDAQADLSVALGPDVDDQTYLRAITDALPAVLEAHRPGLVFYIAGVDPAADDLMGNWNISRDALLRRDRYVLSQIEAQSPGKPLVLLPGGGYGDEAWRHTARTLAWIVSGDAHEPSASLEAVVRMFRRMDRETRQSGPETDSEWTLSEAELGLDDRAASADPRFLGCMTEYAVELSLERFGILDQIRSRGFRHPSIHLEATPPLGHTLRLFGEADGRDLLMEQRVSRNRAIVPGAELLYAEWLMMQNPRLPFDAARRPLPSQRHPGLGLLREVVAWWMVLCERLTLDGILFVPSHYYMAALGRRHMRFLRAEDEATYDAFREAVRGLTLAAASEAIDSGRIIDRRAERTAVWHAPVMVLPAANRLGERLANDAYDQALRRSRAELDFVLG
jgi:acetoin utilization deacetylase AcuC-like enzyme